MTLLADVEEFLTSAPGALNCSVQNQLGKLAVVDRHGAARHRGYLVDLRSTDLSTLLSVAAANRANRADPRNDGERTPRHGAARFFIAGQQDDGGEMGYLVDTFNDMLSEGGQGSAALETSNEILRHEMTERSNAEAALRLAHRCKDEFLATLAHDLRNPLAPLRNALHLLKRTSGHPSPENSARGGRQER